MENKYFRDSIASCGCLIYSYAKKAKEPVVFVHYKHRHNIASRISYRNNRSFCSLFFMLSGNFSFVFDKNRSDPGYGDILIARDREEFVTTFYGECDVDYYEIDFPPEFFESIVPDNPFYALFYNRHEYEKNIIHLEEHRRKVVIDELRGVEERIRGNEKYADMMAYSAIVRIMGALYFQFAENKRSISVKVRPRLKDALEYMHQNYKSMSGIEEVASYCGVTGTYLARIFKKDLGCTPLEYLSNLRVSNAEYLMSDGRSATESCFMSGFENYTSFFISFKRVTGISPSEFIKMNKKPF